MEPKFKENEIFQFFRQKKGHTNLIFQICKIKNKKKWTRDEDTLLVNLAQKFKEKHWKEISKNFGNKNSLQCFSRYKRIRPGIVKGSWSKEEDEKILSLVSIYGKEWSKISKVLKTRNGKQIRDRFINVLDPDIKKGKFSDEEDKNLIKLYIYYGPKWATISKHFVNRTADMIKNRFHSSIKKIFFADEPAGKGVSKTLRGLLDKYNLLMEESLNEKSGQGNPIEGSHQGTSSLFFSLPSTKIASPTNTNENKVIKFHREDNSNPQDKAESDDTTVNCFHPPTHKDAPQMRIDHFYNDEITTIKDHNNKAKNSENNSIDNDESGNFFNFEDYFTV